ncbi:MAG TPA: nucleotide exchange factor GrpE [Candidatus Dormibacteraeota bacterium]|jgi:molecular chaperone GrpE|nr:nucleotide exchange factor GrpE [Candidatus Dormibacteraeota bacterium]
MTDADDKRRRSPRARANPARPSPQPPADAPARADEVPADDVAADGAPAEQTPAAPDERYLRLAADFENFKRRKNQELADRSRFASEEAARALLPVLDNLQRAVGHAGESSAADLVNGLGLVVREFETALANLGVTPIDALGQPFDPAVHEALGGEESDTVDVDTVDAELQRGYRLHDRVLRPALVRVAHPRAGARQS